MTKKTGIRHAVFDVSKGGGKGFQTIMAFPATGPIPYELLSAGDVTVLYKTE